MARSDKRQMRLAAFLSGLGAHVQAWRHPASAPNSASSIATFIEAAQIAEAGKFDFGFIADSTFITKDSTPYFLSRLEPITALAAVAAATSRLGLAATMTTSFSEPFTTARQLASLDLISGGRAAWNAVTGALEGHARNHGGEKLYDHALRYRIADEYIQVVKGLWDSWEDDAFVRDKQSGHYADLNKMHTLNHKGEFFSVQGPLNIERSPQGRPVLFQAGASEAGRELAARQADAVFSGSVEDPVQAKAYYQDIKRRAVAHGRSAGDILIFPSITPVVGATEEDALRKHREVSELLDIDIAVKYLSRYFSFFDFSQFALDEPLPELGDIGKDSFKSTAEHYLRIAREQQLTLRQLALRAASPGLQFVGTAEQVADRLQALFEDQVVDGYILHSYLQPLGLREFVDQVVPILQDRGLVRREYEADTLRGNLGLGFPVNCHCSSEHH
ncbi:LLM class flavin-dependent oxidoreductase [Pseudomonas typographi]|uniref:LLM class flavin-dependent oxidoreductase n=1 Tax=Pseudomonas typographi TaxID=2715964 RepID=A0ABR7Z037_9PSED|nr:LLM class flavin-dependent oxidoreductase [Pseudomonas typographi]MBD1551447.1 LLM class flavin-dependent oxidoreductase [Pseudomonas typographi]MBD1598787.1 LLM class flavin-dependent oxidoreductase [Pseudomonas typographi]